ncbi:MAG: amino acid ABC transporter permease [Lachnospiraceae bacterium]|jgi:cystine transport system permease protein
MSDRILEIISQSFFQILIPGIKVTIPLTLISFALGLLIALFLAMVQIANVPVLKQFALVYIWFFRGTPLLVQLFIVFFGLPSLGIVLDAFPAAVITFALNSGAYNAETLRSAILAVPKGQTEAAELVGLTYGQTMRRIILPQAFPIAFPPLFNSLIGMVKDTSLASSITVIEMFTKAQQIAARTFEPFVLYLEAAAIYLMFCTVLTILQKWLEKKMVYRTPESKMLSADAGNGGAAGGET